MIAGHDLYCGFPLQLDGSSHDRGVLHGNVERLFEFRPGNLWYHMPAGHADAEPDHDLLGSGKQITGIWHRKHLSRRKNRKKYDNQIPEHVQTTRIK